MMNTRMISAVIVFALIGCERHVAKEEQSPIKSARREYVVGIVLDLSGSFEGLMVEDGNAFRFFGAVIEKLFRDRIGKDDRIVLAQISAKKRAMLWEGTPQQMMEDFPNQETLNTFLRQKSDSAASNVYDAVADMVEYMAHYPGVARGETKSAVFVLSDMDDTMGDESSKDRLTEELKKYSATKGVVGMYWVNQEKLMEWRLNLEECGFVSEDTFVVESDIVRVPTVPSFKK
jgi:hypothetical protein